MLPAVYDTPSRTQLEMNSKRLTKKDGPKLYARVLSVIRVVDGNDHSTICSQPKGADGTSVGVRTEEEQ